MPYDLNRSSGALAVWLLGGSTASMSAHFIFAGNYDPMAAAIFQLIGGLSLLLGGALLYFNRSQSEEVYSTGKDKLVMVLLLLAILNTVIMTILGQTVRFY